MCAALHTTDPRQTWIKRGYECYKTGIKRGQKRDKESALSGPRQRISRRLIHGVCVCVLIMFGSYRCKSCHTA